MSTYDIKETAQVLKVHPKTVAQLIHEGALPAAIIGKAFVLLQKDVNAYIEQQVRKQTMSRMCKT